MIERRVDGVAMLTFGMEDSAVEHLRSRKVPLVLVDMASQIPGVINIRIDYKHGIRQAGEHVAALRHVKIAFVMGPVHVKSAVARRTAFEESMEESSQRRRSLICILSANSSRQQTKKPG